MARPDTDRLAVLARQLSADSDLDAVWTRVVRASVAEVEGAEHAGITLLEAATVSTPAATDELVREIDAIQYSTGGPCLTAALDQQAVVLVEDLTTDTRWPQFSASIAGLGVRSMLSFQLFTDATTIGALNLYAGIPDAFTVDSVDTGTIMAMHAAVAAAAAGRTDNLIIALATRDIIGQAKGILMERYKVTGEQAFDLLITASQDANRKLKDIAFDLAASGEFVLD